VLADGQTHTQTHRHTDANRFYNLSHAICYSYGADKKTSQFITQCTGDISHAFKTAKITVFEPIMCKSPDVPQQDELLC